MVFENIAKKFLEKQNQNLRESLSDVGRLETEIKALERRIKIEAKKGNETQVAYYRGRLEQLIKKYNRARVKAIFAEEISDQLTPYLVPFFDVVTLVLGKRVDTISMFYLLVISSIFVFMIIYTALKKSSVFEDTFTSSSAEAGLAILITLLVIRFMPFAYFFFMLLAFLIIAVILSIRLLYGLVADEEHKFGAVKKVKAS